MRLSKITLLTATALSLAACDARVNEKQAHLENMNFRGSAFNRQLATKYTNFSVFESDRMFDWRDADRFADKALKAARGRPVYPENPAQWDIPASHKPKLEEAYALLRSTLDSGARGSHPEQAAQAQVAYDCWVEQQEEDLQPRHIQACQIAFIEAMQDLIDSRDQDALTQTRVITVPQNTDSSQSPAPTDRVFFNFNSAELSSTAQREIRQMAERFEQGNFSYIQVMGHADRVGPPSYNQELSRQRALSVKRALVEAGIPEDRIRTEAYGEQRPLVETGDGERSRRNRRVMIKFQES